MRNYVDDRTWRETSSLLQIYGLQSNFLITHIHCHVQYEVINRVTLGYRVPIRWYVTHGLRSHVGLFEISL